MKFSTGIAVGTIFIIVFVVLVMSNDQNRAGSNVLSDQAPSNGVITTEKDSYEFGTISMRDGDVSHVYELTNDSTEPVTLGEIYTSCMCTSARAKYSDGSESKIGGMRGHGSPTYLNRIIQPGESFEVEAIFDPAAHGPSGTGPAHRIIYIQTNSSKKPQLELTFDANVTR